MQFNSFLEHFSLREYLIAVSAVLITVLLLSLLLPRWRFYSKYRNLPPGPFCWPIIGYAPFLNIKTAHLNLKRAADKYGGMLGIFVGNKFAVVIDDFEILKEAFKREEFCNREQGMVRNLTEPLSQSASFLSGSAWYQQRRTWKHAVRNLSTKPEFRYELQNQIQILSDAVEKTEGKDVNLDDFLELFVTNAASYTLFGKTYESGNRVLGHHIKFVQSFLLYLSTIVFMSMFDQFQCLIKRIPFFARAKEDVIKEENLFRDEISSCLKTMDQNDPQTFVEHFHTEMTKIEPDENKILETLVGNSLFFLAEFVDGALIPTKWLLLLLASHPEIQSKIQSEIDLIVGREREPLPSDRKQIPLLEACLKESLRLKFIFDLHSFRSVSKDTKLRGYDIPKDTMIIFNIWSHFNNPKLWKDPERFDPYRFLSEDGKTLHVPEEFIPFSYGRRRCLGEDVVTPMIYIIVGRILQRFRILPPEGGVNLNTTVFIIKKPAYPLVKFQKRYA